MWWFQFSQSGTWNVGDNYNWLSEGHHNGQVPFSENEFEHPWLHQITVTECGKFQHPWILTVHVFLLHEYIFSKNPGFLPQSQTMQVREILAWPQVWAWTCMLVCLSSPAVDLWPVPDQLVGCLHWHAEWNVSSQSNVKEKERQSVWEQLVLTRTMSAYL